MEDESALVDKVILKVGSAKNDADFEYFIKKLLSPILMKLSSTGEGVRKKIMELLVHVNRQLKCKPHVKLPVESLLTQYQDPDSTSFVINFTIIYIKIGFPRLDEQEQAEMIPILLNCLNGKPQSHIDGLLLMMMPSLKHIKLPSNLEKKKEMFLKFTDDKYMLNYFLEFTLDFLLVPYGYTATPKSSGTTTSFEPPSSMSEYSYKRICGDSPIDAAKLEEIKFGILKFLYCGIFEDTSVLPHFVIGSADTRHSIANYADMELRRMASSSEWSNSSVQRKLYSIFLGTVSTDQKNAANKENQKRPANTRIRLKIFPYLLKGGDSSIQFPACIQVIFGCLFGESTHQKLKLMSVQFVQHICDICSKEKFAPIAAVLLSSMIQMVDKKEEDDKVKALAYISIGKIGKKAPSTVVSNMLIVQQLFKVLGEANAEIKMAVQQTLSILASVYGNISEGNKAIMEALIIQGIENPDHQVRFASVLYASSVFPDSHIPSRYCLLLASGDSKDEVSVESMKGLNLSVLNKSLQTKQIPSLPPFKDLVKYISEKANNRMNSNNQYSYGNKRIPFNAKTYMNMLSYLRMCLMSSAGQEPNDEEFNKKIPLISRYLKHLLADNSTKSVVVQYLSLIMQFLEATKEPNAMKYLLEGISMAPNLLVKIFPVKVDLVKSSMYSTQETMRFAAAELMACLCVNSFDMGKMKSHFGELIKNVDDRNVEIQHGSILALGFLIGKLFRNNTAQQLSDHDLMMKATQQIASSLKSGTTLIIEASCFGLGEIGRNGILPLEIGSKSTDNISKFFVIQKLVELLNSSKSSSKLKGKSVMALGLICVGDKDFPFIEEIIEGLLNSARETTDLDVHIAVGEALSCVALRETSPHRRDIWNQSEEEFELLMSNQTSDQSILARILDKLLDVYVFHTKPSIRQASCIWLLTLLNNCKNFQSMKERLLRIQDAMMNLLGDRSEIIQEFASKALGLLYEYGDENQKQSLVSVLVETLTQGRKAKQEVSGETEVFHKGSVGTDVSGGSISTYKDLCSLATDLNQPDLVYKFMHLANHNAIWNSKKGAAFGFQSIALQAGEKLSEHLPKIIPKLYRYTFDPNPKARLSFTSIWNSLVPESQKMINTYFKEIMTDVMNNLTNSQWRVRESCCAAITDLLRGRNGDQIIEFLPELWETCFKVRDDIKESVRIAAESTLKTLNKVSIKLCDADGGSENAISMILPCLIKSGLGNPVKEVRAFSLNTISQLSRKAGKLLKAHIPILFVALLESLSSEESSALNMMSVRLESSQDSQQKLDTLRIASSKTSPMMDTINYCIQFVDEAIFPDLIPRLIDSIKNSVGLATKAGSAHVVVALVHQCPNELQAYSGKLMYALLNGLMDRNAAIRNCYANALGNIVKVSKDSSIEKLMVKLQEWYMEKNQKSVQDSCVSVFQAILRYSPDVAKSHASGILPLAFYAMHASGDENVKRNCWEEIWLELTPGSEAGIKLYLTEILEVINRGLASNSWQLKKQSGCAIITIAQKLKSNLRNPQFNEILSTLINSLSGRTWDGKESLLQAVGAVIVNCSNDWDENASEQISTSKILECLMRECRKENHFYKIEALKVTGDVINTLDIDLFEEISLIIKPILTKKYDKDADDDEEERSKEKNKEILYEVFGKIWPCNTTTQEKYEVEYFNFLSNEIKVSTWKCQVAILNSFTKYMDRSRLLLNEPLNKEDCIKRRDFACSIVEISCFCLSDMKYSSVRSEALKVMELLITKLNKVEGQTLRGLVKSELIDELIKNLERVKSDGQAELKSKATNLFNSIQNSDLI